MNFKFNECLMFLFTNLGKLCVHVAHNSKLPYLVRAQEHQSNFFFALIWFPSHDDSPA